MYLQVRIDISTFTTITVSQPSLITKPPLEPVLEDATTPVTRPFPGPDMFGITLPPVGPGPVIPPSEK